MQQALDTATQIHERAEFGHRDDAPREHRLPATMDLRTSADGALLLDELLRLETTMFLPPSLYSMMRKV